MIGDGPDAHAWKEPPKPAYRTSASHHWPGDATEAVADGLTPSSSNDSSIPRFTWWDHKGSTEWIQADFEKPKALSRVKVYWFDDTGRGGCRVPASWRLLYRDGKEWTPVTGARGYGARKDRFNETTFEKVTTKALRIEVKLAPDFSGGILEWRVNHGK